MSAVFLFFGPIIISGATTSTRQRKMSIAYLSTIEHAESALKPFLTGCGFKSSLVKNSAIGRFRIQLRPHGLLGGIGGVSSGGRGALLDETGGKSRGTDRQGGRDGAGGDPGARKEGQGKDPPVLQLGTGVDAVRRAVPEREEITRGTPRGACGGRSAALVN